MRRIFETVLFAAGALTLAGCLAVLWWRSASSDALIERFESAQAAWTTPAPDPPARATPGFARSVAPELPPHETPRPSPEPDLRVDAPDQSDWSAYRRRHYQAPDGDALPLAVLRIPAIDLEVPVLAGSDTPALERGVGWLTRTAPLGAPGNAALAGHRDSFFRRLGEVRAGDVVRVDTLEGVVEYRVTGHRIVEPDDVSVLRPQPGEATLTLITCYPFRYVGRAPQRYIVHARRSL